MQTIEIIGWVVRILAALSGACYFYQILYLLLPFFKKRPAHRAEAEHRYAILIAARNEEKVLPALLESLRAQDYPAEKVRVYVCADNCSDGTAAVAREHGALVFERQDAVNVGKGYALHHLLERIDPQSYDVCLVFDADNILKSDYIREMNRSFSDGYEAVCGYRNSRNFLKNWISAGYALWYVHDSVHLNQSRMLLGVSCCCTGTGFGFTRSLLEKSGGWNFFTLTEDIEFDNWCAVSGVKMGYCHDAILYDEQPTSFAASWRQRTRWMQGSIQLSLKYGGRLLRGMFSGKGHRFECYEAMTITIFGYGVSVGLMLAATVLTLPFVSAQAALLLGIASLAMTYLGLFVIGALTMFGEWSRIPGPARRKIACLFTFPVFMATYIPVAVCAPFQKFEWKPTEHTGADSEDAIKDLAG